MRRTLLTLAVVLGAALAAAVPRPADPPEPLAGLVITEPDLSTPLDDSIWYCAWAQAGSVRDSFLAVASLEQAVAIRCDEVSPIIQHNVQAIDRHFSQLPSGRRLLDLYRQVAASPRDQRPCPQPDGERILDEFLDFRRFRPIRS